MAALSLFPMTEQSLSLCIIFLYFRLHSLIPVTCCRDGATSALVRILFIQLLRLSLYSQLSAWTPHMLGWETLHYSEALLSFTTEHPTGYARRVRPWSLLSWSALKPLSFFWSVAGVWLLELECDLKVKGNCNFLLCMCIYSSEKKLKHWQQLWAHQIDGHLRRVRDRMERWELEKNEQSFNQNFHCLKKSENVFSQHLKTLRFTG